MPALGFKDITNRGAKGSTGVRGADGGKGDTGPDGTSLTVATSKTGKNTTISLTDKNGTKTATVLDGADGTSPTITSSKSGARTTITMTDVNGTRTAVINDGGGEASHPLTALASNNTIEPEGHYTVTMTGNLTLNAATGTSGHTADAELFINPGAYTVTAGSNLVFASSLTANAINHCVIKWNGITARLTVVDSF